MRIALTGRSGAIILFDFRAAFPSLSPDFLHAMLATIGMPQEALNLVASLYHSQQCNISMAGGTFPGFAVGSGIRQGCPLSPLLFAAATDILLRLLAKRFPAMLARAFADDTAAVTADLSGDADALLDIFDSYARMSGLCLNLRKTVIIPLTTRQVDDWAAEFLRDHPKWAGVQIASWGTYLGFAVGPGKGTHSWEKPCSKLVDRA